MKKLFLFFLIMIIAVPLIAQTPRPSVRTNWYETVQWILNGQETLTYKTLTSPTITGAGLSGTTTFSGIINVGEDGTGYDVTLNSAVAGNYWLWDESASSVSIVTTSATTSGTNRSFVLNQTQTGASATKILEAMRVNIDASVQTGDWVNAIVGRVDYGSGGTASGGMVAPICSELSLMPGAMTGGAYYVIDLEVEAEAGFTHHANASYPSAYLNIATWGNATAIGEWEANAHLFRTDGFTDATGNMFYDNTIRVHMEGTDWYIPLSTTEGTYTSAHPFVLTGTTTLNGNITGTGSYDQTLTTTTAGGEIGHYSYVTHTTNALTGELIGVRGNARVDAIDSPSGQIIGGKFQAGNMGTGTDASVVRGVYVDVVNKIPSGATTWDYARGYEVSMDLDQGSAGNVNTVTNAYMFYGVYNLPTVATYATVTNGYGIYVRNEAVGGTGQMLDAAFYADDASMSGGISGWDYGLDFNGIGANGFGTADIRLNNGAMIFTGSAANGDAVYAEVGAYDATGSIYLSTAAGAIYIQVANAGAAADWYKVTSTDAD